MHHHAGKVDVVDGDVAEPTRRIVVDTQDLDVTGDRLDQDIFEGLGRADLDAIATVEAAETVNDDAVAGAASTERVAAVAQEERAIGNGGQAAVGVGAVEHHLAGAGFDQAAGAGDRRTDFKVAEDGLAVREADHAVLIVDDRLAPAEIQGAADGEGRQAGRVAGGEVGAADHARADVEGAVDVELDVVSPHIAGQGGAVIEARAAAVVIGDRSEAQGVDGDVLAHAGEGLGEVDVLTSGAVERVEQAVGGREVLGGIERPQAVAVVGHEVRAGHVLHVPALIEVIRGVGVVEAQLAHILEVGVRDDASKQTNEDRLVGRHGAGADLLQANRAVQLHAHGVRPGERAEGRG